MKNQDFSNQEIELITFSISFNTIILSNPEASLNNSWFSMKFRAQAQISVLEKLDYY